MMNKDMIEALYLEDVKRAEEKFDAMIRAAEYKKQDRLAELAYLASKDPQ